MDDPCWIRIHLSTNSYIQLKEYVNKNLFIGVKRFSKNLDRVVIHSIGDVVDNTTKETIINKAQLCLEFETFFEIKDKTIIKELMASPNWYLYFYTNIADNYETGFQIIVDKQSGYIIDRFY